MMTIQSAIVQSTVVDTLREALRAAEESTMATLKGRRAMCRDYYHNEVLSEDGGKDAYLKDFFKSWDEDEQRDVYRENLQLEHIPLTEQLIDLKAKNYREQPERMIGKGEKGKPKKAEKYGQLLKLSGAHSMLKRIEQYTQLLHDIAVGVFLDQEKKKLRFVVLPDYTPVFDDNDIYQIDPIGITYLTAKRTEDEEELYAYYDAGQYILFKANGEVYDRKPNEYRTFNFFFPHRKKPIASHFETPRIPLVLANQAIDVALTGMNHLLRDNGYKQMVAITDEKNLPKRFITGSSRMLVLKPGLEGQNPASVSMLDMQADFAALAEAIKFKVECAAQSMNMQFQWKVEGGPESGYALQIQNVKDTEDRLSQIEILDEFIEQPLYRIVSDIGKQFTLDVEQGDLTVNFPEPEAWISVPDQIALENHKLLTNQITPVNLIMEADPDLTEDEAVAKYENNVKINSLAPAKATEENILSILDNTDDEGLIDEEENPEESPEKTGEKAGEGEGGGAEIV